MKYVCTEQVSYSVGAGKDVWQKTPWWFKCLFKTWYRCAQAVQTSVWIVISSNNLWIRSRANWASSKLLDTTNIRLSQIQGWGAEAALALQLERRGTKGVEVGILTWFDLVHAPTEGWWLPLLEGVILLFLGNAALHVWLHPQLQEQPSLSRALAQAEQAAEPQLCRCSQESAARGKCLLCLCLEKAHKENVTQ